MFSKFRWLLVALLLLIIITAIGVRLYYVHVQQQPFLVKQGNARSERHLAVPAQRGVVVDRHGHPLAMSMPVQTLWIDPKQLNIKDPRWRKILTWLHIKGDRLDQRIIAKANSSRFMYLKRQLSPALAKRVLALHLPGVYAKPAYRRFYPQGESIAPLIGLTNIDSVGQDGIEKYYHVWLAGKPGRQMILRDLKGHVFAAQEKIAPEAGKPIALSLDYRMQYLTYRALKKAILAHRAVSGSAVIMDVHSGEILAMASFPSFNANDRTDMKISGAKNRAVTDVFEPGSVIKPLAMAAVLDSGLVAPDEIVDTAPGRWRIGRNVIRDTRNYGQLDLEGIIQKSSNVGISKLVLMLAPDALPKALHKFGFGQVTGVSFPGERTGVLPMRSKWRQFALATLSFGYGLSVTTLQLAQAYAVIANGGKRIQPTLLKRTGKIEYEQVFQPQVTQQVLTMLASVTQKGGTGVRARVPGYLVAGKTGTSRKVGPGGYLPDSYTAVFVGIIPVHQPKLVMAIMIDDPRGDAYYGGSVAAPVFAEVMPKIMRLLHVVPASS